ncbi:hypothetical protein ABS315_23840 [Peribacillus frigoritolerans]|uniref:hypothetical protein n=1 Tax=Peribacillus frigoritolerans TaxID=450367 RepID=UPI0034E0CFCE
MKRWTIYWNSPAVYLWACTIWTLISAPGTRFPRAVRGLRLRGLPKRAFPGPILLTAKIGISKGFRNFFIPKPFCLQTAMCRFIDASYQLIEQVRMNSLRVQQLHQSLVHGVTGHFH